jgi:hypothetical protein
MTSTQPSKLYVVLIILMGLVIGYVAYSQWIKPGEEGVTPAPLSSQNDLASFKNLKIDFNMLKDLISKGFIVSGESPVNPGMTGKKDLFAPAQ